MEFSKSFSKKSLKHLLVQITLTTAEVEKEEIILTSAEVEAGIILDLVEVEISLTIEMEIILVLAEDMAVQVEETDHIIRVVPHHRLRKYTQPIILITLASNNKLVGCNRKIVVL